MLFNKETKGFETRSDKPNENWTSNEDLIIIDDNSELANKIIENHPYFECVFKDGVLVDITPTERPEEVPMEPKVTPLEQLRADVDYIAAMTGVEL